MDGFALFDTAIGTCGIAWSGRGITQVQLPDGDARRTRERLIKRAPGAREAEPTSEVQRAIDGIVALLAGERRDLTSIVLDHAGMPEFSRRVYAIVRTIPAGKTMTYGEVAEKLGDKLLAHDVGEAMGRNPTPVIMPCHRVLAANGKMGGFSAPGGVATKLKLLTIEGAQPGGPTLFDALPLEARRVPR